MKDFAQLFTRLDQTNKTNAKVDALVDYFAQVDDADRLWTIALMAHRRPRRTVNMTLLRAWAAEYSGMPLWLFEESYHVVGDLAETIALMLPPQQGENGESLTYWVNYIRDLQHLEDSGKQQRITQAWSRLNDAERFVFNKLITGNLRVGLSQKLMIRALAAFSGVEENSLTHRLMGNWVPDDTTFQDLVFGDNPLDDISKPYPFYLAYQLEATPDTLGEASEWQAEYKWDGIRGQLIVRQDTVFLWSRGEELVTDKFPELAPLAKLLPNGTVIDGEILPFANNQPLPFSVLQTRIGRKNITKKHLETSPVVLMAYDLLEWQGQDIRQQPLEVRRRLLQDLVAQYPANGILRLSTTLEFATWEALADLRAQARERFSEGVMLKRVDSPYRSGRKRGDWWKWKVDALTVDAVLLYAQRGHGRRANLYTDFTFAVWNGAELVPFTKAYSGLTDAEFRAITQWVNRNTIERFGPVRSVKPELVFEIAFEGIQYSNRHKSGIALRFPRMNRWRIDKPAHEANTLADLQALLAAQG